MTKKIKFIIALTITFALFLTGCQSSAPAKESGTLKIVTTTTMLADLAAVIGREHVTVNGLMGPGIDPHLYQASAGDVTRMQEADVILYNGLHLEGKMGEIFESLSNQGSTVIRIEDGISEEDLLSWSENSSAYDPHIWFDVSLWKDAAQLVAKQLSETDADHSSDYAKNLELYLTELDALDTYIKDRVSELPKEQRVLITAHDAFHYFGRAYSFEVKGLQGISTDAEAGTGDVSSLADFIAEKKIKSIFVESSVPPKTIKALQAAVKAKGFDVAIGGQLYSDSLGGKDSGAETYILTVTSNIDTIVEALK
ncbi:manganese transporter [Anaerocolumna cellulosilytica]|uniref:Manganese transporter n=1 Tax=Anaerocolumna cellulosilytica TaxID=433286 RepID=A0A6S6R320_9FIRM|nr:zinc ABC transporter substrate-binding protein [Anaerocolumna cellulosilytica]MBB5196661.1 manganese/zinc/iron transport system substrate-binding protein [Anaerocolumna cellulosilytica]BCJ93925.1 manganese transporter [Anaerocolumna cellulosilytica]